MIRFLLRALCVLIAMTFGTGAIAYSDEQISHALEWESKWSKVTNRAISKYTARIGASLTHAQPATREAALQKVRTFMRERFSWKRQGRRFVSALTKSCDRRILETMAAVKLGEQVTSAKRRAVARQYKKCAMPGYRQAMRNLVSETRGFKPRIDQIIRDAKA